MSKKREENFVCKQKCISMSAKKEMVSMQLQFNATSSISKVHLCVYLGYSFIELEEKKTLSSSLTFLSFTLRIKSAAKKSNTKIWSLKLLLLSMKAREFSDFFFSYAVCHKLKGICAPKFILCW